MPVSDDLNGLNNLPFLSVRPLDVTVIDSFSALLASVNYLAENTNSDTVSIKNTHYSSPESLGLTAQHLPLVSRSPVFISGRDWNLSTAAPGCPPTLGR